MTHTITPPPELVQQLYGLPQMMAIEKAYQVGADQELAECCEWIADWYGNGCDEVIGNLRTARRPKPLSLKEQALTALLHLDHGQHNERYLIIRRALEQLND